MQSPNDILNAETPFFIVLKENVVTLATGEIHHYHYLKDIPPVPQKAEAENHFFSVNMIPFAQMRERGFEVRDDGLPIISLEVKTSSRFEKDEFFNTFTFDTDLNIEGALRESLSDEAFAEVVGKVIKDEISEGEGANFLISRKFHGKVSEINPACALTVFSRLCQSEISPYMVFCFFDGEKYFICASPERHLSIKNNTAYMNPICGTLPKKRGSLKDDLIDFVQDEKEINELFMVVDETLKLMMPLCPSGGEVIGPYLREMSTLIHTENELRGVTDWDPIEAFRATMFAPTMVGSPLESACRVIRRNEPEGRRYYSSAMMILKSDEDGKPELDSTITIRMVEFQKDGNFTIQAGASIVRDSIPEKEAIESRVKANGMLKAMRSPVIEPAMVPDAYDQDIERLMLKRNERLSPFWINQQSLATTPKKLKGKSVFIINNEDDFVYMIAHLLEHMGATVKVESVKNIGSGLNSFRNFDLVLIGPGPGDPNDDDDSKMNKIRTIIRNLKSSGDNRKFFGICLGHQIICSELGLAVAKLPVPLQGVQKPVDLFDETFKIGFYNTFCPRIDTDFSSHDFAVAADKDGYVFATRGPNFGSLQGHPESILSKDGYASLQRELAHLLC